MRVVTALTVVVLAVAAAMVVWFQGQNTNVTAYFSNTKGLYAGDEVRIRGLKVGTIDSITPQPGRAAVRFHYDSKYAADRDARAAIVSPALLSVRYIQLTPGRVNGPKLADGAVISEDRTAVPVEFDDVKKQLSQLTDALGPNGANKNGSLNSLLNAAAKYKGQGQNFHQTVEQVSQAMQTLSDGRSDLFGSVRNLQVFVRAIGTSDDQIEQFMRRLDSVSGVLDDNKDQLAVALRGLDSAAEDVTAFLKQHRAEAKQAVGQMADVSSSIAKQKESLEQALHVAPTVFGNFYGIYSGRDGSFTGSLDVPNLKNPSEFVCSAIQTVTEKPLNEAMNLCKKYAGPLLNLLQLDHPPVNVNPTLPLNGTPPQVNVGPNQILPKPDVPGVLGGLLKPKAGK
ncbi:MCE family protein [Sciscionella marina]|uniref:MCE family protein n=1 Tax=Sciscionella marina TaxID=508770 RepID=UPI00058DFBBF|nr:MCE family protein [Sciscionella marina]